ncbi:hypothetical protein HX799_28880, partial [Pseudomonas tolaasii]|uniref:hypothetical protein n=1 Tax=Pseudomonas tolaasii TaxID=29442 RepID=UPI0015C0689B
MKVFPEKYNYWWYTNPMWERACPREFTTAIAGKPAPTRFSASNNHHNNKGAHHVTTPDTGFAEITHRELGLRRQLTSGQMSMIAIGGAIGTG